jgi:hypothetical protein
MLILSDTYRRERVVMNSNAGSSYSKNFDVPAEMLTPPARFSAPTTSQHQGWVRASHITPSPPDSSNLNGTSNTNSWNAPNQRPSGINTNNNAPLQQQNSSQVPSTRPVNPYRVARPNNPYKSNHSAASTYASTNYGFETSSRQRESERNANHLNIQHPHRAGLIRENRQFGTALEITSGREERSKSNERPNHQFQAARGHAHNEGPPQTGVFDTCNTTNVTILQNKANPQPPTCSFADSDDENPPPTYTFGDSDDEDDSELLEFVAFQA